MVVDLVHPIALCFLNQLSRDIVSVLIKEQLFIEPRALSFQINKVEAQLLKLLTRHREYRSLYYPARVLFPRQLCQVLRDKLVHVPDSRLVIVNRVDDLLNDEIAKLMVD